jgi:sulfatase maturation enzyme AslB (radical SAM superfamily)
MCGTNKNCRIHDGVAINPNDQSYICPKHGIYGTDDGGDYFADPSKRIEKQEQRKQQRTRR